MDWLAIKLCEIPGVRVHRQNVGTIPFLDPKTGEKRVFRAGPPPGAADLSGIYKPNGKRIEVETKAVGKKRSEDQERWASFIKEYNGIYFLAPQHKGTEAEESAIRWAKEFREFLKEFSNG